MPSLGSPPSSSQKITAVALRALDALLLRNPERTALGVMLGFTCHGALSLFAPALALHHMPVNIVEWWECLTFGVVIVHLPFILWSVRHKPLISDELETLLQLIEFSNIGELEKRQAYRRVVNKCIEEFSLSTKSRGVESAIAQATRDAKRRT
jgi:hypothetical protein